MIKFQKKGFTFVELLTVMLIAIPVLIILYVLLSQSLSMYDSVRETTDPIGAQTSLISDIEDLSRNCDYAEVVDGIIVFYNDGIFIKIDPASYGLAASFAIDHEDNTITIMMGGEKHCVKYLQQIGQ